MKRLTDDVVVSNIINADTYISKGKALKIGAFGIAYSFANLDMSNKLSHKQDIKKNI